MFVSCERTPSQWPMTTGTWLHRLEQTLLVAPARAPRSVTTDTRMPIAATLARAGTGA
jgi:hypothetical protein